MQEPLVCFESEGMLLSDATVADARRHIRRLEAGHPAVQEWRIRVQLLGLPGSQLCRVLATVSARSAGGVAVARATERDMRGAVRAALRHVEGELETLHAAGRARAATWLMAVRRRLG